MQWRISAAYSILLRKNKQNSYIQIKSDVLLCSQTEDYQGKRVYEENVQEEQL